MILDKRNIIDKPRWRPLTPASTSNVTLSQTSGQYLTNDYRNRNYADPYRYMTFSTANALRYNVVLDGWQSLISPSLAGGSAQGCTSSFAPSQGPKGTITTGNTTNKIVLSTALPASVNANQLADRGDGLGYIIRIIGNATGSSGKTEERRVVSNSSGTTPTLYLDSPLSFTPISGDAYEFLSGRAYYLNTGAPTAGQWKYYDVLTASMSGNLSTTNLPTVSAVWNEIVALDESHVPYNRFPGEGFLVGNATYDLGTNYIKKCLTATASAAGTLTGQSAGGDANLLANEYRNFQIRVVMDVNNPTAVGQRRRITSHTAGASPVYTLSSNWTVTPSATCMYVLENDNDKLILFSSALTTIYNYNHTANTWDTTTWAARGAAMVMGPSIQQFGLNIEENRANNTDTDKNQRHSFILSCRGGGTSTFDIFDIAGASTGSWTSGATFPALNSASVFLNSSSTYSQWAYDNIGNQGRYIYIAAAGTNSNGAQMQVLRLDLYTKQILPYSNCPAQFASVVGSSANIGNRAMCYISCDPVYTPTFFSFGRSAALNSNEFYELMIL